MLKTILILVALGVTGAILGWRAWSGPAIASPQTQPAQQEAAMEAMVQVKVFNGNGKLVGPVPSARVVKTDAEWRKQLTPEEYKITRGKGTEAPFCGNLLDNHQDGVYACVCCRLPLFASNSKFDSGTGWPSFFQPVAAENVLEHPDKSLGMQRTEILCARCDAHLGHVFTDGPRPTGLRFCVNSESLTFTPAEKLETLADRLPPTRPPPRTDEACCAPTLAGSDAAGAHRGSRSPRKVKFSSVPSGLVHFISPRISPPVMVPRQ